MDYIKGTFIGEQKTRFVCDVRVGEEIEECYVPSSCKLSRFLDMKGKEVLLIPVNKKNARTRYSLYAVKKGHGYILLNLMEANRIIEEQLNRRCFSFLGKRKKWRREYLVEGYKADLFIEDTDTLIEIKTVISSEKVGGFPSMKIERATNQLVTIMDLLEAGYKVVYLIISLNPRTESIHFDRSYTEFFSLFDNCIKKGMRCRAYAIKFKHLQPEVYKEIKLFDLQS